MATIYVENLPYPANPEQNLLANCLSLGFNLPYFCWHPAFGSVGACRQCAVKQFKDENDTRGKIVMACMTPALDGTRISIEDREAVAFRAGVIEGLMLNHPHDCPVCDEGGECHLQDMTAMTGHNYRRYAFNKRTFRNQYLGSLVHHEMNRCIQCYRCVRFYRDYAGGRDLNAFSLRNTVFFGREKDGALTSEFSGNLVEICPTGVFTDATLKRHYTRKWDLQMAPSVCIHCGLGCNTTLGERYGLVRRILNRYHGEVNGYFLCDRGRFGYEIVNSESRIREPSLSQNGQTKTVGRALALEHLRSVLVGNDRVIGIGSPRASLEANYALRELVGTDRFYSGMSGAQARLVSAMLEVMRVSPAQHASLRDVERSDAVLILGEDVTNVAPRMALSLRQSVRQRPLRTVEKLKIPSWLDHAVRDSVQDTKGPLFIAAPFATRLDDIATETYRAAPDDLARVAFAVAHQITEQAPDVPSMTVDQRALAGHIASALKEAQRPLVVTGTGCNSLSLIHAAANLAQALQGDGREPRLSFIVPECNTVGLALMDAPPLDDACGAILDGTADTVIILENDLYWRAPEGLVTEMLNKARHVVALDYLVNRTTKQAQLVLPVSTFAESDGTLVNNEGRAQRFFQVLVPTEGVRESWRWLRDAGASAGRPRLGFWNNLDDIIQDLSAAFPALASIDQAAPGAQFRIVGAKVARQPPRYSGRTAMSANLTVHEPKPPEDTDSPLSFSMEGYPDQPPAALIPYFWSPGWNSIQATNKYQSEIAGPLRGGDAGVRLIERAGGPNGRYFDAIPNTFLARRDEWLFVPLYHIFSSEELGSHAPAIAQLVRDPYLALSQEDANRLHLSSGQTASVKLTDVEYQLSIQIEPHLCQGIVGVLVGRSPLQGIALPAWGKISKP
jgi:NADH-quinone oxidoreductase subunit G